MLSIDRAKKLINDPSLSDEEVERIRDYTRSLAELIFDKWQLDRNQTANSAIVIDNKEIIK